MDQHWAEEFLTAAEAHLQQALPLSVTSDQQQDQDHDTPSPSPSRVPVPPRVLIDLAYAVPFLSVLPCRGWQCQFLLVVTGQFSSFTPQQSADMINALAHWKAIVISASTSSVQPGLDSAACSESLTVDLRTADMPLPLIDGLMGSVASAEGLHPAGGAAAGQLGLSAMSALPDALRVLAWPADEQVVAVCIKRLVQYHQLMEASKDKTAAVLDRLERQLQQAENNSSGTPQPAKGKSKKRVKKSGRSAELTAGDTARLKEEVLTGQAWMQQASDMLDQVQQIAQNWQALLDESRNGEHSGTADNDNSSSNSSETQLNADSLMTGMLTAAKLTPLGDRGDSGKDIHSLQIEAAAAVELDGLLSLLGAAVVLDEQQLDSVEVHGNRQEDYIDTTAVDLAD